MLGVSAISYGALEEARLHAGMFQAAQVVCGGFSLLEPAVEADYDFGEKCKERSLFNPLRPGK